METGRCIILAALWDGDWGEVPPPGEGDLLLCADRGYLQAKKQGLSPALTVGDFDSLPGTVAPEGAVLRLPREKDDTDTAVCLREGRCRGYRSFWVGGGLGGRLDHTLANLQLSAACALRGERLVLWDALNRAEVLPPGDWRLPAREGRKLSLLAWTPRVEGVTLTGARWPLAEAVLEQHIPLGVSNEWTAPEARLSFRQGLLLVCVSMDGAVSRSESR